MIYQAIGEKAVCDGKQFAVGDRVIVTDGDYAGLKGIISEIRTGADKETENETEDIYCSFDLPESKEEIKLIEEHFSALFGTRKTIDDLSLDLVIMASDEVERIDADE